MQTFLPYLDFRLSALALDHKRLGKQRVEALQLLQAHYDTENRWRNHPVFRMWYRYPGLLAAYGLTMCNIWTAFGYSDNCKNRILETLPCEHLRIFAITTSVNSIASLTEIEYEFPQWMLSNSYNVQNEYRATLLAKDPKHYGKQNWSISPKLKMTYPIYPIEGDEIIDFGKVAKVISTDCLGEGFVINHDGAIFKIAHVEKIRNSVHHTWRVDEWHEIEEA